MLVRCMRQHMCSPAHLNAWQCAAHLLVVLLREPHVVWCAHHCSPLPQPPDQAKVCRPVQVPVAGGETEQQQSLSNCQVHHVAAFAADTAYVTHAVKGPRVQQAAAVRCVGAAAE
jgi:hypothetical protein